MGDLRERAPGHALIEQLLREWDAGHIHVDAANHVVIEDEARGWYAGVLGERRVADRLRQLDPSWTVLHSMPVGAGSSDIDHVVISQAGVFTINTKHHAGKRIWAAGVGCSVEGFKNHYVPNSIAEARRAGELLSKATGMTVPVTAVLVFVDPGSMKVDAPGGGPYDPEVRVVAERDLIRTIAGRAVFSREQAAAIAAAAREPETWHRHPIASAPAEHVAKEFDALVAAVMVEATPPAAGLPRRRSSRPHSAAHPLAALILSMSALAGAFWWLSQLVAG